MPEITLTYNTEKTSDDDGNPVYLVTGYISATEGFTEDPGNNLLLCQEGPDDQIYFAGVCGCSDLYNYPDNSSNAETPYYRRSWFYRKFDRVYKASDFVSTLKEHLEYLSQDWEYLHTAGETSETRDFTGGSLDITQQSVNSIAGTHEDGSTVEYSLITVKAELDTDYGTSPSPSLSPSPSPSPSPVEEWDSVFVLSGDDSELFLRVAVYEDMDTLESGDNAGDRTDSLTFCVNSSERKSGILDALVEDLEQLNKELEFI